MKATTQQVLDKLAIGASTVCAVHCALLPIVLTAAPALAILPFEGETFHKLMLLFVIPSSSIALFFGCRRHKDHYVLIGGVLGLVAITLAGLFGHDLLGDLGEKIATVIASGVLAAAHWRNFTLCRHDHCEHAVTDS